MVDGNALVVKNTVKEEAQEAIKRAFGSESSGGRRFNLDAAFDADSSQEEIFEGVALPAVMRLVEGYNACVMAYGQTGSGKTHTMLGGELLRCRQSPLPIEAGTGCATQGGVAPRTMRLLLSVMKKLRRRGLIGHLTASYCQIHKEQLQDLLADADERLRDAKWTDDLDAVDLNSATGAPKTDAVQHVRGYRKAQQSHTPRLAPPPANLQIREDVLRRGMYVQGAREVEIENECDVEALLQVGERARIVGDTVHNRTSSRSHAVLTLYLRVHAVGDSKHATARCSKLLLIDLAGSERSELARTSAALEEGVSINKSLSALAAVMKDLADGRRPTYRASRLTRLLQDALGSNAFTVMICCINPHVQDHAETLSTLRLGTMASLIKSKPQLHLDTFAQLRQENRVLRERLREMEDLVQSMEHRVADTQTGLAEGPSGDDGGPPPAEISVK